MHLENNNGTTALISAAMCVVIMIIGFMFGKAVGINQGIGIGVNGALDTVAKIMNKHATEPDTVARVIIATKDTNVYILTPKTIRTKTK